MPSLRSWITLSLLIGITVSIDSEDHAFLELTEFGYEDVCYDAAHAEWTFINSPSNQSLLSIWEEKQIAYSNYKKVQQDEVRNHTRESFKIPSLRYKYNVLVKPGDALLDDEDLKNLIHFAATAEQLRNSAVYTGKTEKLSRIDVERLLSQNGEVENKRDVWAGWYRAFNPLVANYSNILPLVSKAAEKNGINDVTEYWETLSEYPDGYKNIAYEWRKISDLHKQIVQFAASYISHKHNVSINNTIPAHLLGTLQGYDWSSMTIEMMPYTNLTYSIRKNLWKQKLLGTSLYKSASSLGMILLNQVPHAGFWKDSRFNQQCPPKLLNFCKFGVMKVSTCFEATISNLLFAHKNIGKILFNQMSADNYPILNIANRYSGIEEGISELFGIFSASPAWLNHMHLMKNSDDDEERQIVSLMITALDVIPRLAYYLSADTWRLYVIQQNITDQATLISSWWKHRAMYEGITSDLTDVPTFLDDSYIINNKPYLPKIVGILLSFQLYEYLMESTEVRYEHIKEKSIDPKLINMIRQGGADNWMPVLEKYLEIDEIYAKPLISFFAPLKDFLDEMQEEFDYKLGSAEESELENLKQIIIQEINSPSTTPAVTMKTKVETTTPSKIDTGNSRKTVNVTSKEKKPLESESAIQADKPADSNTSNSNQVAKVPFEKSLTPDSLDNGEDDKPKINTSKAVWAVAAVLIAIVTICVIAIFGRQRCRKTPKNRRYV